MRMGKYGLRLGAALLAAANLALLGFGTMTAQAEEAGASRGPGVASEDKGEGGGRDAQALPAVENGQIIPANLSGAAGADQLIVVVGTGGCFADISYYKKDEGGVWNLAWKEAGIVGRNGITWDKREGDGKTPAGTFGFTLSFGLKDDPGSVLPYHKIVKGDYWVDDSASPYYNKLVNTSQVTRNWSSAENMIATSPYYNYGLALDYNPQCEPGMGSAIFLHCFTASADNGSAGCIRLPEARAMELVQSTDEKTRIVIAPELSQLR